MPERNYKRFFEHSQDLLCIVGLDGRFIEVNDAFTDVLGYPKTELIGALFEVLVHPHDIESTFKEIHKITREGATVDFQNQYLTKSGSYVMLSWSAGFDPESGHIFGSARDVTEQSNQARKLKQIEEAINEKFILVETDNDGVIIRANHNFCEISGYSEEELIGNTHRLVNSGVHTPEFFKEMWQSIKNNKIWSGDITNKKKNGDLYHVRTTIAPITNSEGSIEGYLALRQDITDQVEHQQKLAKTLEFLNDTSSSAKVGGWELNVDSGLLTWTDETFRILEVEEQDSGTPLLEEGINLFIPEHAKLVDQAVKLCIEEGKPYELELLTNTPRGNKFWVYTNGKANYENGRIKTISGTIQDIRARKEAEYQYNLEKQKSIQSAKLASLGELAASMAHEINNPLGIISGYSELLLRNNAQPSDVQAKIEVIHKSCKRISHIVNSLKRFSREEGERKQEKIILNDVIKDANLLTQPRLKRCMVDLRYKSDSEVAILGNAIEIEQVFLNLINNALDAIKILPERWLSVELEENGEEVKVRVTDSGKGIKKEDLDYIFSPFYTTKKVGEGTGLGLSIVVGILKDHNAKIEYDGNCANTSFVLTFKCYQGE